MQIEILTSYLLVFQIVNAEYTPIPEGAYSDRIIQTVRR